MSLCRRFGGLITTFFVWSKQSPAYPVTVLAGLTIWYTSIDELKEVRCYQGDTYDNRNLSECKISSLNRLLPGVPYLIMMTPADTRLAYVRLMSHNNASDEAMPRKIFLSGFVLVNVLMSPRDQKDVRIWRSFWSQQAATNYVHVNWTYNLTLERDCSGDYWPVGAIYSF